MEDVIQNFVEGLLEKSGINDMPEEFKKEQLENLKIQVEQRLGMMAISELDEAGITAFEDFMSKNQAPDSQKMMEFFNAQISGFETKVQETLTKFGQEFVKGVADLKGTKLSQ
ncbi:hypothetical protein C4566_00010 [Candidatus Parcubacteria bacterium]|nr:MAG: hypothetical protein C4566_00010 [Candidatus Parcubacteria bacterium]